MSPATWRVALECGAVMSLVAGGYLVLLLRLWPRVFLRRYPEEVRHVVRPLSARERLVSLTVSMPFLGALLAFPSWAAYRRLAAGGAGFAEVFWAAYGTWMLFNLFDWLVLDEGLIGLLRPRWLILEGAEHVPLAFDHGEHALAFLKGSVGGAVLSAVVTLVLLSWA